MHRPLPAPGVAAHLGETASGPPSQFALGARTLRVSRTLGAKAELTLDVFNLLDRQLNDIEYFYESRLPSEAAPVADRHVHPAEPRTLRLTLRMGF